MSYADPQEAYEYRKAWQARNKEKCDEYAVNYRLRHPERTLVRQAKARAEKKGIEFSITEQDIQIPELCPVFGFKLYWHLKAGAGGKFDSISLDRIDNNKGYIPGNVQVISSLANRMKTAATPEQLVLFAKWVLK